MYEIIFIQDLAIIMSLAGLVTIIFHRLKQPIVLGYMLVGLIVGPHTPPAYLISDPETIHIFSHLGVIFLMFSLGLEFSLHKLLKVGPSALVAALLEIVVMIFIGYEIGKFFHWKSIDALFLGAMLAISSTTIIVKALSDLNLSKKRFAQLIFGVLVIEDILAIAILALLTSIGKSHSISTAEVAITLGKLLLFLIVSLCVGILTVPRFLAYVEKFKRQEILLIAVLGLCFGFCLLVVKLQYSIVLGAFIIGAIIAESRNIETIERLVEPLRDMFSAVFFVAVGLMLDPKILVIYAAPIAVVTVALIFGKVLSCGFGMFITGQGARSGLRVGMGLAQIGEFSFIIASLGLTLDVTSQFLYPIAVAVSAVTTLLTPYLIKLSDPLAHQIKKVLPKPVAQGIKSYTIRLRQTRINQQASAIVQIVKKIVLNISLNTALVFAIFISLPYIQRNFWVPIFQADHTQLSKTIFLGIALAISLPFLIAIYRKVEALTMLLLEFSRKKYPQGYVSEGFQKVVVEIVPILFISLILYCLVQLSHSVLPSTGLLFGTFIFILFLAIFLRGWFIKLHSRLQSSFTKAIKKDEM